MMEKKVLKTLLDYTPDEQVFYAKVHQDLQELNRLGKSAEEIGKLLTYTQDQINEASRFRQLTLEAEINEELYY